MVKTSSKDSWLTGEYGWVLRIVCVCVCARSPLTSPSSFQDSLDEYPCGGEHTPNPIASTVPLKATPTIVRTTQLTAVTTATEAGHTIALLGDKKGELLKVDRWVPSWMQTPRI